MFLESKRWCGAVRGVHSWCVILLADGWCCLQLGAFKSPAECGGFLALGPCYKYQGCILSPDLSRESSSFDQVSLCHLVVLSLKSCKLRGLGDDVAELGCLKELYLETNRISSLPQNFTRLRTLEVTI